MAEPSLFPKNLSTADHLSKQSNDPELIGQVSKNVNNVAATLRILEERYSNLRNKSQLSEQTLIDMEKETTADIHSISEEISDMKHDLKELKDKIELIINEIGSLVDKNEFHVLDRYLDMWQPMNFVTRDELSRIIKEKMSEK